MNNMLYPIFFILFISSINALSEPKKAYRGNQLAIIAMGLTLIMSFYQINEAYLLPAVLALICGALVGTILAARIKMPNLPQLIALLNGFGGLSAGIIGITESSGPNHPLGLILLIIAIGFITFGGSTAAFLKLATSFTLENSRAMRLTSAILLCLIATSIYYTNTDTLEYMLGLALLTTLWGFCFILPIGGADMAIVISLLNAFSGWSTVAVGFSLENALLIIVGTLIGSSGIILTYIMTKAMHRNIYQVIFQPFIAKKEQNSTQTQSYHQGTIRDAAFLLENAHKVIIIPGFGMAAANAQNEIVNMAQILKKKFNVKVKFAIHPVAGRMPGHMNVLLAEADADSNDIYELKDINQEFPTTDVAFVIGANDITNPIAKTKKDSPLYQMPILEVEQAKHILIVKRSLSPGYAQIDNPLFYKDNTLMLLGDAQKITKQIIAEIEND